MDFRTPASFVSLRRRAFFQESERAARNCCSCEREEAAEDLKIEPLFFFWGNVDVDEGLSIDVEQMPPVAATQRWRRERSSR